MNDKPFESAFAKLPELVDEWRKKLDTDFAALVQIPSQLPFKYALSGQVIAPNSTTISDSPQPPAEKLRLACAQFCSGGKRILTYPDILSTSMCRYQYPRNGESDSERTGSIWDRFGIKYMEEASYIVYACGLDPNVATVVDMDCRNARLECLFCRFTHNYTWREALWHASGSFHRTSQPRSSWKLVGYKAVDKTQVAELSEAREASPDSSRCLLCRPRVGDENKHEQILSHLTNDHGIEKADIKRRMHYLPLMARERNFMY
ncbi:hypothetical protein L210DRAFT_3551904 [Boletus edulis BED1]|uniref:Uncharacterized protein n=1 Tax=Boletus edulis BED1 TaxID=1328754 RepID=A0AAD4BMS1_BOLED|nr:hypothetical protein L210DRAFT_3551904 [Boletus edulis BED1]